MPKQSKMGPVKRQGTRAAEAKPPSPPPARKYICCRCQSDFSRPDPHFFKAQSTLYKGNTGHIHICKACVNDLFDHYFDAIGDGRLAMQRICEKFDLYWNEDIWASVCMKTGTTQSRAAAYFRQANLRQYEGKTFDDWHDEGDPNAQAIEEAWAAVEAARAQLEEEKAATAVALEEVQQREAAALTEMEQAQLLQEEAQAVITHANEEVEPTPEQLNRWGAELPGWYYDEADRVYRHWDAKLDPTIDREDAANWGILKQICLAEVQINEAISRGKQSDVARLQSTYNTLIGSASLKPGQRKDDTAKTDLEDLPLGVLAKIHEGIRPIQDLEPELQDIDMLRRTHFAMFLGGLAKMFKMKNRYAEMFDAEFARFTAKAPERAADDEDDCASESLMAKMFGGDPDG